MRITRFFAVFLFCSAVTYGQTAPATPSQQTPTSKQLPSSSSAPLRSNTRLVTIDVIVRDSHGTTVRDLKKEDFQITEEHNREQQIDHFAFIDRSTNASARSIQPTTSAHIFSNVLPQGLAIPPTVLLMDALNTDIANQSQVHQHMVALLKTLPRNTPVAVFVLGNSLRMLQTFSTDPELLRAAVDKTVTASSIDQNPLDDPDSISNTELSEDGGDLTSDIQLLQVFEAETYEAQMAIRVDETTGALIEIAKYLTGYSGRKNLIWFSESFPYWIAPSLDSGSGAFAGMGVYTDKIDAASEALSDARVAVYPVDAKGLAPDQIFSAAQNPPVNRRNPGRGFATQISRQNQAHLDAQGTMEAIAETTGGRTCENTNDLSGCVQSALNDGSSYYELAFYPQDISWDGRFHKITVKSLQHGLKMTYRRGYIATDNQTVLKRETPDALLKQACQDPLPSTSISLTAEPIPPAQAASQTPETRYLLTIPPSALSFTQTGENRQMGLRVAICEYNQKGSAFQYFPEDLSRSVTEEVYRNWQTQGVRNILDYDAKPDDPRFFGCSRASARIRELTRFRCWLREYHPSRLFITAHSYTATSSFPRSATHSG
jgi:VWFA-related protein